MVKLNALRVVSGSDGVVGIARMKLKCIFFTGAAVVFAGCAGGGGPMGDMGGGDDGSVGGISEVPNPSAEMAKASGKSLEHLQRGHVVYMLNCGQCHAYPLPEQVDIMDFEDVMPKMINHAGLPSADEKAVLDYIVAVKKQKGVDF